MEGYESMDEIKKIFVENGKVIVKEGKFSTICNEAEIEGPSLIRNKDGKEWIETKAEVIKLVHIPRENIKFQNDK